MDELTTVIVVIDSSPTVIIKDVAMTQHGKVQGTTVKVVMNGEVGLGHSVYKIGGTPVATLWVSLADYNSLLLCQGSTSPPHTHEITYQNVTGSNEFPIVSYEHCHGIIHFVTTTAQAGSDATATPGRSLA